MGKNFKRREALSLEALKSIQGETSEMGKMFV